MAARGNAVAVSESGNAVVVVRIEVSSSCPQLHASAAREAPGGSSSDYVPRPLVGGRLRTSARGRTRVHGARVRRVLHALLPMAMTLLIVGTLASPAAALIRPAVTIDGPSSDILSLGGVAMAPDGTGGLVYLRQDQGEPHVFVSRFING